MEQCCCSLLRNVPLLSWTWGHHSPQVTSPDPRARRVRAPSAAPTAAAPGCCSLQVRSFFYRISLN